MADSDESFDINFSLSTSLVLQQDATRLFANVFPSYNSSTHDDVLDVKLQLDRSILTTGGLVSEFEFKRGPDGFLADPMLQISKAAGLGDYHIVSGLVTQASGRVTSLDAAAVAADGPTTITLLPATMPVLTGLAATHQRGPTPLVLSAHVSDPGATIRSIVVTLADPVSVRGAVEQAGGRSPPTILYDRDYGITQLDIANPYFGNSTIESGYFYKVDVPQAHFTFSASGDTFASGIAFASRAPQHVEIASVTVTDSNFGVATYTGEQLRAVGFVDDFDVFRIGNGDLNADGRSDILWQKIDGSISTWSAIPAGTVGSFAQATFNAAVDRSWHAVDSLDFNGDGRSDILYQNSSGALAVWASTGSGFDAGTYYRAEPVSAGWRIAATGDLDGDGRDDLLWQQAGGAISVWSSSGTGFVENSYAHASPGGSWLVVGVGDFNGDNKTDILWRDANGVMAVWNTYGDAHALNERGFSQRTSTSWNIDGIGDFDGDGRDDLLWRNDNGAVSVWHANDYSGFDQGTYNSIATTDWHIAQVGDFTGDGRADILWRNDNGAVSTWASNGPGFDQGSYDGSASTQWHIVAQDFVL